MKKITISLLFLAFSLLSFAQSAFTEKTFNDLMAAYAKDPAQFLKTETAPDFVFVALTGRSLKVSDILGMLDGSTANTWAFTNVKTRQYGATGIAVSSFAHTHTLKSGNFLSFKESLTSVFAFQQGKWVLVSWHNGPVETEKVEEEAAIKTVIEKESQAFRDRDAEAMISYHANVPYSELLVRHDGGVAFTKNTKKDLPETYRAIVASLGKPDGTTFKNTDYVIHIKDNTAFVTYDETDSKPNGNKLVFHEVRYMEKINDKWQIVYVGAVYDPLSDKADDEKQIQAATDAFIKSWNNHDFSDMKNYLTEDCDWINPLGMLWKNRKEVMYAHDAYHKTFLKNTTMTKEKTTIRFTTADAAVVHIVVHLTEYTRPNNQKMPAGDALNFMVFTKKGDKWLISSAQITNIDAAAQEMNPVKTMPKE